MVAACFLYSLTKSNPTTLGFQAFSTTTEHLSSLSQVAFKVERSMSKRILRASIKENGGVIRFNGSNVGDISLQISKSLRDIGDTSIQSPFKRCITPFSFCPSEFVA